jgi:hypothetical protein
MNLYKKRKAALGSFEISIRGAIFFITGGFTAKCCKT